MKIKLFKGLWAISNEGTLLSSPSYRYNVKTPAWLGYRAQRFLNRFAYVGMEGTRLLFAKPDYVPTLERLVREANESEKRRRK